MTAVLPITLLFVKVHHPTKSKLLATRLQKQHVSKQAKKPINTIGLGNSEWVAMDYSDVLVHIFQPETRSFYNLEELWQDAKLTNIPDLE